MAIFRCFLVPVQMGEGEGAVPVVSLPAEPAGICLVRMGVVDGKVEVMRLFLDSEEVG